MGTGFSAEEKAVLVAEYFAVERGRKGEWLAGVGITSQTMSRWRRGYFFGDLERSLIPRDTESMSVSDGARLQQLQRQLALEQQARAADQERHAAEIDRLNKVNDALGKAIGLLHDHGGRPEPTDES